MAHFTQLREVLSSLAAPALQSASRENPLGDAVTLGAAAGALLLSDDPAMHHQLAAGFKQLSHIEQQDARLIDPQGRRRGVYYPFVLHLHLSAFGRRYETLPSSVWGACEEAIAGAIEPVRSCEDYSENPPPPHLVHLVLWQALAIAEQAILMRRDIDAEWVDGVVYQIVKAAGENEALQPQPARDQNELAGWAFREWCGLHALANLALVGRNRHWSRRVEEVAAFHGFGAHSTHAPVEPWALFAFAWSTKTRRFAEQTIGRLQDVTMDPLSAMLLADAVNAMVEFEVE